MQIQIKRETFHKMMRMIDRDHGLANEVIRAAEREEMQRAARQLSNATAAQVGGMVTISLDEAENVQG